MAVFVPGSIVTDIRGSVGSETYSRAQGGLVVKARSNPSQPESAARDATQANMTAVSQAWSGRISSAQRAAWHAYGRRYPRPNRFGALTIHGGYVSYIRANCSAKVFSQASWVDDPPDRAPLATAPFVFYVQKIVATYYVTIFFEDYYDFENGFRAAFSQGKTTNVGVSYYSTPWQVYFTSESDGTVWTPLLTTSTLTAWAGDLARAWLKCFVYDHNSGAVSIPFFTSTEIFTAKSADWDKWLASDRSRKSYERILR